MMSDFLTRIGNAKSEDEIDKVLEKVTRAQRGMVQAELNSIPCVAIGEGIARNASYALAKLKTKFPGATIEAGPRRAA
jgi:hypothetical protein